MYKYKMEELVKITKERLEERGIEISDIAKIVYDLQIPYSPHVTYETCLESVEMVLAKREVVHAVLTGLALDKMAMEKKLG